MEKPVYQVNCPLCFKIGVSLNKRHTTCTKCFEGLSPMADTAVSNENDFPPNTDSRIRCATCWWGHKCADAWTGYECKTNARNCRPGIYSHLYVKNPGALTTSLDP